MRKAALRLGFLATATALAVGFAAPTASAEATDIPVSAVVTLLANANIDIAGLDDDLLEDLADHDSIYELEHLLDWANDLAADLDIDVEDALWILNEELDGDGLLGDLLDGLDIDLDLDLDLLDDLDLDDILDLDGDLLGNHGLLGDLLDGDLLNIDADIDLDLDLRGTHSHTAGTGNTNTTSPVAPVTDVVADVTDTVTDVTAPVTDAVSDLTNNLTDTTTTGADSGVDTESK
ncbi:hypothetical protein [Actinokineospora terrae]|uniref:Uncharacterized protein n=1 Tax=Actinokineospora terrae TaxID=155974 RepID=A0A1H9QS55_9PSEU|nr:hypothetical protein [Actinokineospora terrae]SER63065.1 hypothetical protein SAMN04487818_104403 [Actinokineospora terrae]